MEDTMDPATFIVTALAGAILKEVATDTYKTVKRKLVNVFDLGTVVDALEKEPADEDTRDFVSKKLAKSGALDDPTVVEGADAIATELEKLPEDTALGAYLTVKDIRAEAATFRRMKVRGGGHAEFNEIELRGQLTVEDIEVGDDRKP
jgi:hypothetical protein